MTIKSLVQNALADNIDQLRTDFSEELGPVLASRMNDRKQEIARSYFGQAVAESDAKVLVPSNLYDLHMKKD